MPANAPKGYKGAGMEGWVARWYARTRGKDMEEFRRQAKSVAERLHHRCEVLEVAPGPGFFAIELAKLGVFKISGLDVSRTFVEIARANAQQAGAKIDFRLGNVSVMPFADESFDFVYCSAAFKNFSEPVKALNEMYRVLRPNRAALIVDLRKDTPLHEIESCIKQSGRSRFDAWLTKWAFRCMLLERAYTKDGFVRLAEESRFGTCRVNTTPVAFEAQFTKPRHEAA